MHDVKVSAETDGNLKAISDDIDDNFDFVTHALHFSSLKPLTQRYFKAAAEKLKEQFGDDIEFDD